MYNVRPRYPMLRPEPMRTIVPRYPMPRTTTPVAIVPRYGLRRLRGLGDSCSDTCNASVQRGDIEQSDFSDCLLTCQGQPNSAQAANSTVATIANAAVQIGTAFATRGQARTGYAAPQRVANSGGASLATSYTPWLMGAGALAVGVMMLRG